MNKELQQIADKLIFNFERVKKAKDLKLKGKESAKQVKISLTEDFFENMVTFVVKEKSLSYKFKSKPVVDVSSTKNIETNVQLDGALYDLNDVMKFMFEWKDYFDVDMFKRFSTDVEFCVKKYPNLITVALGLQPAMTDKVRTSWELAYEDKNQNYFNRKAVAYNHLVPKMRKSKNTTYILDYTKSQIYDFVQLMYNNLSKVIK